MVRDRGEQQLSRYIGAVVRNRLLAIITLTLLGAAVPALTAPSGAQPTPILVLSGNGMNVARLGSSEATTVHALQHLLGESSLRVAVTPGLSNCGVESMAPWHALIAYFNHDRLVGLSLGPGTNPAGRTTAGLELGDTLRRARTLYGKALRTSNEQGGAWFVRTSNGQIDGYLEPSDARSAGPTSRILTIDVGDVGCPAMSP
jgi:hypothetical protein